jgi:hypothetical protein
MPTDRPFARITCATLRESVAIATGSDIVGGSFLFKRGSPQLKSMSVNDSEVPVALWKAPTHLA